MWTRKMKLQILVTVLLFKIHLISTNLKLCEEERICIIDRMDPTYQSMDTSEQNLLRHLFCNYSVHSRPVKHLTQPVHVNIQVNIVRLDSVSEKEQSMRTKLHISYQWKNLNLAWKRKDYNNVTEVIMPKSKLWTPPVQLLNEASRIHGEILEPKFEETVKLTYDGTCLLYFSQFFKSTCEIDVSKFPFDDQTCTIDFGSWSMDSTLLKLTALNGSAIGKDYKQNGEWEMTKATLRDLEDKYEIQEKFHSIIRLELHIERKHFFFVMNLVVPCALIACMIFLVFVLPPKSGERISLGITVMLSMAIFQELSSEKLPSSSDNYPLLGVYYSTSMFEIGIALIMNCFILNLYYRNYEMPVWVRRLVLGKLARLVRVHVPEDRAYGFFENNNNELAQQLSTLPESEMNLKNHDSENSNNEFFQRSKMSRDESTMKKTRTSTFMNRKSTLRGRQSSENNLSSQSSLPLIEDLTPDEKKQLGEDWRTVARVVDRIMLFLSVSVGVLSALTIFMQAKRFREMFVA
ncbi:neuronal acetylcholine receptor subunit alpha-3-like isoform X2 [Hydractinia symbiolongicarpus]|uniref:neuronal acetylcholine receptor subunit alpha-3-like isoform X2 n=1 Tax=Hydractinia symbiolongicarpus TaxID=13093 RepID=UPI0025503432|nr:neuronal acetylcholine receptor subunit alpha-3-like isoform X2 [Hydractinia symbiolongicarpus]